MLSEREGKEKEKEKGDGLEEKLHQSIRIQHQKCRKEDRTSRVNLARVQAITGRKLLTPDMLPSLLESCNSSQMQQLYHFYRDMDVPMKDSHKKVLVENYENTSDKEQRYWILRVMSVCGLWGTKELESAVECCENKPDIIEDVLEHVSDNSVTLSSSHSNLVLQGFRTVGETALKTQFLLTLIRTSLSFSKEVFEEALRYLDTAMCDAETYLLALGILEELLRPSNNQDCYIKIPRMRCFPQIVESCKDPNIDIHQPAFEICINILTVQDQIAEQLVNTYGFMDLMQRFLQHISLAPRAYWAMTNLVVVPRIFEKVLPLVEEMLKVYQQGIGNLLKRETMYLALNLLNSLSEETVQLVDKILPKILQILREVPSYPSSQLHVLMLQGIINLVRSSRGTRLSFNQNQLRRLVEEYSTSECQEVGDLSQTALQELELQTVDTS